MSKKRRGFLQILSPPLSCLTKYFVDFLSFFRMQSKFSRIETFGPARPRHVGPEISPGCYVLALVFERRAAPVRPGCAG